MKLLQTTICLYVASIACSQDRVDVAPPSRWLAHVADPELTSLPGRWHYVSEFRQPALGPGPFRRAVSAIRDARSAVAEHLVRGYAALERYYDEAAADGGQSAIASIERETVWIDRQDPTTFAWRNEGGQSEDDRYLWQVCVLDDGVVSRSDTAQGSRYTLGERKGDLPEHLHLFVQMRVHAAVAYYFVAVGTETERGYEIDQLAIDRALPAGFRMPLTARSGILRVQPGARGSAWTATIFDERGRPLLEWESVWVGGVARVLREREYLEGTGEFRSEKSVRLVSRDEVGTVPDPVGVALGPTEIATALDLRSGQGGRSFDPRNGIPVRLAVAAETPAREVPPDEPAAEAEHSASLAVTPWSAGRAATATRAPDWVRSRLQAGTERPSSPAALSLGALVVLAGLGSWWLLRRRRGAVPVPLLLVGLLLCGGCGDRSGESGVAVESARLVEAPTLWSPSLVSITPEALTVDLRPGEIRRLEAHLVNNTEETLVLDSVSGTCGCVFTSSRTRTVAPYATALLEIEAKAEDYAGSSVVQWHVEGDSGRAGETRMPIRLRVR